MISSIRPYELFALDTRAPGYRQSVIHIPHRRGFAGLTLLETSVLLATMRAVDARTAFEFGTFVDGTTLNIAANLPDTGRVFTLDLGRSSEVKAQQAADVAVSAVRFAAAEMDYVGSREEVKIEQLYGNSAAFDFSAWRSAIDLCFIDGGHDLATVRADTLNAFDMVRKDSPTAILWHDYRNPDYPDLTGYLDALSANRRIVNIGDTMLCLWLSDEERGRRS